MSNYCDLVRDNSLSLSLLSNIRLRFEWRLFAGLFADRFWCAVTYAFEAIFINQQKVITNPSSQPGDSGAALIDSNKNVIGFATYRTGVNAVIPFSVWVWAEEIYYHHKL